MEQPMEHPSTEGMEHTTGPMEQPMEHPSTERMEHTTGPMEQPMEHPSTERMEHPAEAMEQPMEHPPAERIKQSTEGETQPTVVGSTVLQSNPAPTPAKGDAGEIPLAAILRAVEKLQRHLAETDDTISRFADRNGIPRRDVSLFLRHKENLDAGKRCAPTAKIRTIMAALPE
jgi:hypothetical protein